MDLSEDIIHIELESEMDIVVANKRAIQIGELSGLSPMGQTQFATAVSEISRNCIQHAQKGTLYFNIIKPDQRFYINARISDNGPGISEVDQYLHVTDFDIMKKGVGLAYSKKIVDYFDISTSRAGTTVSIGKELPRNIQFQDVKIIRRWRDKLTTALPVSPYDEIKIRNMQLIDLSDKLKTKNLEIELQLEENKRLNDILQKKNENLKNIAYTLAHDLKNPLSAIKMAVDTFYGVDPDQQVVYINSIGSYIDKLFNTINGIIRNIEFDPEITMRSEMVNLSQIIRDLKEQFNHMLIKVRGEISVTYNGIDEICYPQVYIYSMFCNLLSNSIKYSSENPLKVKISFERKDKFILLRFSDNGIGIDLEKNRDKLFKPFNRFTSKAEGKGIGLSIVKHIATKNGGKVEVESSPGKGTEFLCYLAEYEPALKEEME